MFCLISRTFSFLRWRKSWSLLSIVAGIKWFSLLWGSDKVFINIRQVGSLWWSFISLRFARDKASPYGRPGKIQARALLWIRSRSSHRYFGEVWWKLDTHNLGWLETCTVISNNIRPCDGPIYHIQVYSTLQWSNIPYSGIFDLAMVQYTIFRYIRPCQGPIYHIPVYSTRLTKVQ